MVELGLRFTFAYLLGSALGSLIVGYLKGGVDIRRLGSGNAGGTNALRTQGKWFALWVMVIDVGKGILAAAVLPAIAIPGVGVDPAVSRDLVLYAVALGAIVGHVFPVWFDFRGGKGGATAAGLLVYLEPAAAAPVLGLWVAIVLTTGYVGLATITAGVGAALFIALTAQPDSHGLLVFASIVAALLIYTHRGNIRRMLNGTESRFSRPMLGRFSGSK